MPVKNHYFEDVYDVTRLVPRGRVTTYGAIANFLQLGSARMVGWALSRGHERDDVPAHRVVNRKGELSGRHHFNPPERMQQCLELENVAIENDAVRDFEKLFWNPSASLDNL